MPYFDHVRCHSCKAMLDPESLSGDRGLVCPRCGVALNLQDLFGLSDAFAEEEEGPVSLDDLVPASKPKPRPAPPPPPAPSRPASAKPTPKRAPPPPAPAGSTSLVPASASDPDDEDGGSDALEALRSLRKKKKK